MTGLNIVLTIVLVLLAVALAVLLAVKTVWIIPQERAANVERFGRYRRTLQAGLNFVVPFLDRVRPLIDLREQVVSFEDQPVITADNLVVHIDTVLFFQVTDPHLADYGIVDYAAAIEQREATTLRSVIGSMDLEQTLTSPDRISAMLCSVLDEASGNWGIRVTRVEIKAIDPAPSIMDAMEKQYRAQQEKRAAITVAEGERQAAILKSEGQGASIEKDFVSSLTDGQARAIATSGMSPESSSLRDRFKTRADYAVGIRRLTGDPKLQSMIKVNDAWLNQFKIFATVNAKRAARNSQIAMSFGFLVLIAGAVVTVVTPASASKIVVGVLASLGAVLSGYIGRTFLQAEDRAMYQLDYYSREPLVRNYMLEAERLANKLRGNARENAQKSIIESLLSAGGREQQLDSRPSLKPRREVRRQPTAESSTVNGMPLDQDS